ncbi:UDP-N-acetylmuramoyl-L-alanine--D-glutamate ligase [Spirochaetia bacterium 38H-sp]|uniref:UDP-N-acetylmuramoylalanine--D-glutamate ligase n=1 Tax=Rarispira pelagica TaxID=3141764 RepID=A0ABU9U8I3_9SPIR
MKSIGNLRGKKVLIMGLGLHGGGVAAARFCVEAGAHVSITDLRDEKTLQPSLDKLKGLSNIEFILGTHREEDFKKADIVIKNPGVPKSSPFLKLAKCVETDISLFLRFSSSPVLAVTGSKGKSTTVSALHHILSASFPDARLGGNITHSPLNFLKDLKGWEPVVLELSSWQLGDLQGKGLLNPRISLLTNIYPDHQNSYLSMQEYVEDKLNICLEQSEDNIFLYPAEDPWGPWCAKRTRARTIAFYMDSEPEKNKDGLFFKKSSAILRYEGKERELFSGELKIPGKHNRINIACAAAMAYLYGIDRKTIEERAKDFSGIPHRLEYIGNINGVRCYNDSAATIPDAVVAAVSSFSETVHLITGGTDKNLDLSPYIRLKDRGNNIYLISGSATNRLVPILIKQGIQFKGPFMSLEDAIEAAISQAKIGDVLLFSPGAASFEMFKHEFDRGDTFRKLILEKSV